MVVILNIETLKKRKQQLQEEKEKLIEQIKTRHSDFYDWSIEKGINLDDLSQYSANIAAAFVISIGGSSVSAFSEDLDLPFSVKKTEAEVEVVKVIDQEELQGKNETERSALVWERYGPIISRQAEKYRVDEKLIFATIMLESGGNTNAVRHEPQIGDASYGLGQILYGTARLIGFSGQPQDLYDPETNIELVARYHRRNMDVYGPELTPQDLTIAYNAGSPYSYPHPGHVDKFNRWYQEARHLII